VLAEGTLVDQKYLVGRLVGEGGMGVVYEGTNIRLGRKVAIKVMHSHLTMDRDLVMRFEREAKAAGKIGSSHIADVLDMGDLPDGDRYMVMEFLEGESLHARIKERGRLTVPEVADICVQLLEGLEQVHAAGIIHRDLKPANIFITTREGVGEFVKILDFGCCKMSARGSIGDMKSGIGSLFGTLPYMAPEHFEQGSSSLDLRADLYSVGVVMYRCVAGQLPYRAQNLFEMIAHLREGRAAHLLELAPEVDKAFAAIVDRGIEWDPAARFKNAREFADAIITWKKGASRLDRILHQFLDPDDPGSGKRPSLRMTKEGAARLTAQTEKPPARAAAQTEKPPAAAPPQDGAKALGAIALKPMIGAKRSAAKAPAIKETEHAKAKPKAPPSGAEDYDPDELPTPPRGHRAAMEQHQADDDRTVHKRRRGNSARKIPVAKPDAAQAKKRVVRRSSPDDEIPIEIDSDALESDDDDLKMEFDDKVHVIKRVDKK
jgi:serine/threonine protein kinase